jgi:hypothetical protein
MLAECSAAAAECSAGTAESSAVCPEYSAGHWSWVEPSVWTERMFGLLPPAPHASTFLSPFWVSQIRSVSDIRELLSQIRQRGKAMPLSDQVIAFT